MKLDTNKITRDINLIVPLFLILTIVAVVNSTQFFFFLFQGNDSLQNYTKITFSKLIYFYYFVLLTVLLASINSKFHLKKKKPLTWISFHVILLMVSFFLHQTITFFIDKLLLNENSPAGYRNALFNNPNAWIDVVAYILIITGILLLDSKRISYENEVKCAQLEALLIKSKLQELRTRIHPQFLFKTLGTIKVLIGQKKNREANKILTLLSDFLRTTVYESGKEEIELMDELRFLNIYLSIENTALEETISYKENINAESRNALMPIFIIQPIVEAMLYELAEETNSTFELNIETSVQSSNLRIKLEAKFGKGIPLKANSIENLEAVKIVKERLQQSFAASQSFEVCCANENQIEFRISFPFRENSEEPDVAILMEN